MGIYVGDPDVYVTGTHTYTVGFTVDGVVNSGVGTRGEDEIFWNIIGSGFDNPLEDVRVALVPPSTAAGAACWYGDFGADTACDVARTHGDEVAFAQSSLRPGQDLTVAAAYEGETFSQVIPRLHTQAAPTRTSCWYVASGSIAPCDEISSEANSAKFGNGAGSEGAPRGTTRTAAAASPPGEACSSPRPLEGPGGKARRAPEPTAWPAPVADGIRDLAGWRIVPCATARR